MMEPKDLLAIMQADLTASGARTGEEIEAALVASVASLQPDNPYASINFKGPFHWSDPAPEGLPRISLVFGPLREAKK